MSIPLNYVYLLATFPLLLVWLILFSLRKDLRKEILILSVLIGFLSVATSYFWWTVDWWRPMTIFGTKVGIEDFIMGFASGGIMATVYEIIFRQHLSRKKVDQPILRALGILLLLAQVTSWLFWGYGLTSFWASTISMIAIGLLIVLTRKDLFFNALGSAILMASISSLFYAVILSISSTWIDLTYMPSLSGLRIINIPVEEFVFWFLAGFVFGPFYEYCEGERLRKGSAMIK